MKLFAIEESDVEQLETAAKRLYTEQRMDGNAMRDLAHALTAIAKRSREVEIPESKKCCTVCGDPDCFES